jgi:hypothetical protein
MELTWENLAKGLTAIGGLSALFAVISRWVVERALKGFEFKQQLTLEAVRTQAKVHQDTITAALSRGSEVHLAAQSQRLDAVKHLWQEILNIRTKLSPVLQVHDMAASGDREQLRKLLRARIPRSRAAAIDMIPDESPDLETCRPFLGERLWVLFVAYRAVGTEVTAKLIRSHFQGNLLLWFEGDTNQPMLDALERLVPPAPYRPYLQQGAAGLRELLDYLEVQMLVEVDKRISGKMAAEVSVSEALALATALSTSNAVARSVGRTQRTDTPAEA